MTRTDLTIDQDRANLYPNLEMFKRYCSSGKPGSERAFQKITAIWDKVSYELWYKGYWYDYLKCVEIILSSAEAINDVATQAALLNQLAWAYMEREEFTQARQYFDKSIQKFRLIEDAVGECKSFIDLATLYFRQRRLGSTIKCYQKALNIITIYKPQLTENQNLIHQEASLHNLMGSVYLKLWNFEASRHELEQSLNLCLKLDVPYRHDRVAPLLNRGRLHFIQGDYEKARQYFNECLEFCDEINRTDMKAGVLLRLAELAKAEWNNQEADRLAKESEKFSAKVLENEVSQLRNRAHYFRQQIKGQEKKSINVFLSQLSQLSFAVFDLVIASPMTAIQTLVNYVNFRFNQRIGV
jgi:tetratricopeptide (TPR) repeat protein